jgi:hypothetical protein
MPCWVLDSRELLEAAGQYVRGVEQQQREQEVQHAGD